jgi:hypothetical protein
LVQIERENYRSALGVVRQTVLLKDGLTRSLDLGGTQRLAGRLLQNGMPLRNVLVRLSQPDESSSPFVAFARTNGEGAFEFRNVPPGNWLLAYQLQNGNRRWNNVRSFDIEGDFTTLGEVDHRPIKVLVRCEPFELTRPPGGNVEFMVVLRSMAAAGGATPSVTSLPKNAGDPYVFENVPSGRYEVIGAYGYAGGMVSDRMTPPSPRMEIDVTTDRAEQQVVLTFPVGRGSIRGQLNEADDS